MSSPAQTVNDLMQYLRQQYHLNAPVLPFSGMSAALVRLWNTLVGWFLAKLPPVSEIVVEGDWDIPLPTGRALGLKEIHLVIELESRLVVAT